MNCSEAAAVGEKVFILVAGKLCSSASIGGFPEAFFHARLVLLQEEQKKQKTALTEKSASL